MALLKAVCVDRPLRAAVPVLVTFESESFTVRDFTLDLSVGGMFLITSHACPWGTSGTLKFRTSQFEEPFTMDGRVVRIVTEAEARPGRPAGLGIEFLDPADVHKKKLGRLVDGAHSGTVVEAIRNSIRGGERTLDQELRNRPVDQKLMLAINARPEEITALIRDGNPTVIIRLLDSPRVTPAHTMQALRNRNLPTRVLTAIYRAISSRSDEETRWLFVTHPNAMFSEVVAEMKKLNGVKLRRLTREPNVRENVRTKAREFCGRL
jgi:hypothetical protein